MSLDTTHWELVDVVTCVPRLIRMFVGDPGTLLVRSLINDLKADAKPSIDLKASALLD